MKLSYYPYINHLMEDFHKPICSEQSGILQSAILCPTYYNGDFNYITLSGKMPNYHKAIIDPSAEVQYHLGGYGKFYEEAIVRYIGEGIERYSLMVSQFYFKDQFRFATYRQLESEGNLIPFEYIDIYSEKDCEKLNNLSKKKKIKRISKDDIIGWIQCPSLFENNKKIWLPLQMIFAGYMTSQKYDESRFTVGFSKGTAAHTSLNKALLSAILEFVEIDASIASWYTKKKSPKILVDNSILLKEFPDEFSSSFPYDIIATDITTLNKIKAHIIATQIVNKKNNKPLIVYGVQADLDPVKCFYRSSMEAKAITFLGTYGAMYSPDKYLKNIDKDNFLDLDTNVSYYAQTFSAKEKKDLFMDIIEGEIPISSLQNYSNKNTEEDLLMILKGLKQYSEYAVYLDVTPPEAKSRGWHVVRVFVPELLSMCLPGVPQTYHPRFKELGGITNEYPHPLP